MWLDGFYLAIIYFRVSKLYKYPVPSQCKSGHFNFLGSLLSTAPHVKGNYESNFLKIYQ